METQIWAWVMDVFFIFTLHILYKQLLGVKYKSRLLLFLVWSLYFLLWNVFSYLFLDNTLIICMGNSIINFLLLCVLYNGSARNKVVLTIVVVILGIVSEGIAVFMLKLPELFSNGYHETRLSFAIAASALSKIFWFILVKLITVISVKQSQIKIKMTAWIEILLVPAGSIVICYVFWWNTDKDIDISQILILAVLLTINLATYYMYQQIQAHVAERIDNELLKQQNEYFRLRYEETEKQWIKLRRMRHDMANSYVLEMEYLEREQYDLLREHYYEKLGQIKQQGKVIHTGNIGIDSILNYKLEIAREYQIDVDYKIKIENEVTISNVEMNIMIGNLLDNAIESVRELDKDKRIIFILIKTNLTEFFMKVRNFYKGERGRDESGNFLTKKKDHVYHGLGLKEVKEIVKKHDGEMYISDDNGEFTVKILAYMNRVG